MQEEFVLITGPAIADGIPLNMRWRGDGTVLLNAYLGAGGGTATCTVTGNTSGGPTTTLVTFTLSGANDKASYIFDMEKWPILQGHITNIAGGALATLKAVI